MTRPASPPARASPPCAATLRSKRCAWATWFARAAGAVRRSPGSAIGTSNCTRHPRPGSVWPVRVRAHAFAPGRPSPRPAALARSCGVRARRADPGALSGQRRHHRAAAGRRVTYWHVELPRHDVVFAEELAVRELSRHRQPRPVRNGGPSVDAAPRFRPSTSGATAACADCCGEGEPAGRDAPAPARARAARSVTLTRDPALNAARRARTARPRATGDTGRCACRPAARGPAACRAAGCRRRAPRPSRDTRRLGVAIGRLLARRPRDRSRQLRDSLAAGTRRSRRGAGPTATPCCRSTAHAASRSIWR